MRFVLTSRLKEGATLGEPLKSTDGKILLNKGEVFIFLLYIKKYKNLLKKASFTSGKAPKILNY